MKLDSGIYIVTLNNNEPISVNADRPKIADRCIKVTSSNCKVGRAKSFSSRRSGYFKTFGKENVNFYPIVATEDFERAERLILSKLGPYRVVGRNGRKNEWLERIDPLVALTIVVEVMEQSEINHRLLLRPRRKVQDSLSEKAGTAQSAKQPPHQDPRPGSVRADAAKAIIKKKSGRLLTKLLKAAWRELKRI